MGLINIPEYHNARIPGLVKKYSGSNIFLLFSIFQIWKIYFSFRKGGEGFINLTSSGPKIFDYSERFGRLASRTSWCNGSTQFFYRQLDFLSEPGEILENEPKS